MYIFIFILFLITVCFVIISCNLYKKVNTLESQLTLLSESSNALFNKMFDHLKGFQETTTTALASLITANKSFLSYIGLAEKRIKTLENLLNFKDEDDNDLTSLKDII